MAIKQIYPNPNNWTCKSTDPFPTKADGISAGSELFVYDETTETIKVYKCYDGENFALKEDASSDISGNVAVTSLPDITASTPLPVEGNLISYSETNSSDDTITTGTTAYDAGDVINEATPIIGEFDGICTNSNSPLIMITDITLTLSTGTIPSTTWEMYIYDTPPTAIAAGSAYTVLAAERPRRIGKIELDAMDAYGQSFTQQINQTFRPAPGNTSLYYVLRAVSAWTPSTGADITAKANAIEIG